MDSSSDGKEKYILPFNADPDLCLKLLISRNEIFDQIVALNPKSVTIFFDTCYSGVSRDEQMLLASARPLRILADDENKIPKILLYLVPLEIIKFHQLKRC